MSRIIDLERLKEALTGVAGIEFALVFGSARDGRLPKVDSDLDVAVYLDHTPDFDERVHLLGIIQDALLIERVDLVFLNVTENVTLQREALKGRLLICRDPELYASFFSLTDRRGRDEEDRMARAWKIGQELTNRR